MNFPGLRVVRRIHIKKSLWAVGVLILLTYGTAFAQGSASQIAGIAPASAGAGESVTITGIGFGGPNVVILVGGLRATVVAATGSRATFLVPRGLVAGPTIVTATNPGGHTGSIGFNVKSQFTLTLDAAHAATQQVGSRGGTIEATSGGKTYRLIVPPGALPHDEAIVVTPIVSIAGFPLDVLLGAVHLAPEGLQFFAPAILTIDLPPTANTHNVIGFGAAANGDELHPQPITMTGGALAMPVTHFSVAGAGTGTGSLGAFNTSSACAHAGLECTYVTQLATAWNQALQQECGTDCALPDELAQHIPVVEDAFAVTETAIFHSWFQQVLNLLQTGGLVDDAGAAAAGHEFLTWSGWVTAFPCGDVLCQDTAVLDSDLTSGRNALGAVYLAALQRAQAACDDHHAADFEPSIEILGLWGRGGLPADVNELRAQFGCQLVINGTFPASVQMGQTVTFAATVGLRTGGPNGLVTPLAGTNVNLQISDGCGTFANNTRSTVATTDSAGSVSTQVKIGLPCNGAQNATVVRAKVDDILDPGGVVVAFRRQKTFSASIGAVITVSPQNTTVAPGGTVAYTVGATGLGPLFTWSTTGGTITPGPSATATFTAGGVAGIYSVTATSVDDPTQSQTVAVIVFTSPIHVLTAEAFAANAHVVNPATTLPVTVAAANSGCSVSLTVSMTGNSLTLDGTAISAGSAEARGSVLVTYTTTHVTTFTLSVSPGWVANALPPSQTAGVGAEVQTSAGDAVVHYQMSGGIVFDNRLTATIQVPAGRTVNMLFEGVAGSGGSGGGHGATITIDPWP